MDISFYLSLFNSFEKVKRASYMEKLAFPEEIEPLISIFSTLISSISSTPKKYKQPRIL